MRLVCPRCSAEYEIDDRLIPASGREVECSSCENVWFQPGRLRVVSTVATPAEPRLGQPLPEDVMDILRNEAAHFRANHPGIEATDTGGAAPVDPDTVAVAEADSAPLTTPAPNAAAAEDHSSGPAPGGGESLPMAEGSPDDGTGAQLAHDRDCDGKTDAEPVSASEAATGQPPADLESDPLPKAKPGWMAPETAETPYHPSPPARRRGGFGTGFVIGLLIAAVFLGLYMAAPHAGEGLPGDILRAIRAAGDDFHHWVQAQVARLQ